MDKELHEKLTIRLFTDDNQRCFGPGIATLLERVREYHSLRAAAASMEMAYSKAWRIIRTAEEVFGCKMLYSTIGGRHGGGAELTPQAARLVEAYRAYESDVKSYASSKFEESFGFYRELDREPPEKG
jgi:molybdate transport repressor ModE-like protein